MRLFLYGTLLDPETLAQRSGDPSIAMRLATATLRGWERVALPDARWPTLRRRHGGCVVGVVVDVGAAAARRLAAYEGSAYRLTPVVVTTPNGSAAARAWIAPGGTHRQWKE
jgi:gamma-glutamylcyclotransferase (GGCT)/AIG2-like uncharacterized protein YtfP